MCEPYLPLGKERLVVGADRFYALIVGSGITHSNSSTVPAPVHITVTAALPTMGHLLAHVDQQSTVKTIMNRRYQLLLISVAHETCIGPKRPYSRAMRHVSY